MAGATPPGRARLPQPFIMHKMAFHRGRALGIIRNTLRSSLPCSDSSDGPGAPLHSCPSVPAIPCLQNLFHNPFCLCDALSDNLLVMSGNVMVNMGFKGKHEEASQVSALQLQIFWVLGSLSPARKKKHEEVGATHF